VEVVQVVAVSLLQLHNVGDRLFVALRFLQARFGRVRLLGMHGGGRLGHLGRFAIGLVLVVLVHLRDEIAIFAFLVNFALLRIGRDLGAITEKDDAATVATAWLESRVKVHVDVIRVIVNAVVYSRTTVLSCIDLLETELFALGGRSGWVIGLAVLWRRTWTLSIGHPLRDILIPLLLCLSVEETNDSNGHVVTTNASRVAARSQAVVHHVLADRLKRLLRHNSTPNELDDRLRRLTIPDTWKIQ
jgi:hypothetical protein